MSTQRSSELARQVLFVLSILTSAFLIFLVQPMVGKRILPWFGGAPSVWTLCLAFYQTTLFLGYAYAHLLIRFASPRGQLGFHFLMVIAAVTVLPVLPGDAWQPAGVENPGSDIFAMLASNVALPFMVLASTGPLVQAWFARRYPDKSPYPLYAVSNAGSFAALLAYPFVIEPRLTLSASGDLWSIAFGLTALAVLGCGAVALGAGGTAHADSSEGNSGGVGDPGAFHIAMWFLLSGCAVILLMGVTNSVCLDIASVPFLWILPLATYLFTFILSFSSERVYRLLPYGIVTAIGFVLTLGFSLVDGLGLGWDLSSLRSIYVQIPGYCALLFGSCMIMHGELYRMRPAPEMLTTFYLCVSGGGALGGLFVGLLAPVLFNGYYEVRVGLGLAALLVYAATSVAARRSGEVHRRSYVFAGPIGCALVIFALWPQETSENQIIHQVRSFFGVLRVEETRDDATPQRHLTSGSTLHGVEFLVPGGARIPSSYFGPATGIGLALRDRDNAKPINVGIIGLGIGTLSAYGQTGDRFRFFEIDPAVVNVARDSGLFTYMSGSDAEVDVVLGDGRLAIADELRKSGSQGYDFLVVDAFSSDAIPLHLLTIEAFTLYAAALAEDGVLAVHVSNRYFDLMPRVARVGFELGLGTLHVINRGAPRFQSRNAHWILMSRNPERLAHFTRSFSARVAAMGLGPNYLKIREPSLSEVGHIRLWTDDYSDLFGAIRR